MAGTSPAMTEERVAADKCGHDNGEDRARDRSGHDRGWDLRCARVAAWDKPGRDDPCVSETRPRDAAYFFSEVLLLRGSSAGLT